MPGLCAFPGSVHPQVLESPRQREGMESRGHGHQEKTAHSDLKTPSEYSWWEASVDNVLSMVENLECLNSPQWDQPLFVTSRLYQELFSLPETIS